MSTDRRAVPQSPVRELYEALPYPMRDPADESKRLARTWLDDLRMLNHYCHAGRRQYVGGFRVLVAGGGTGDGTVFIAEQLRDTDAEVVHLDFSAASLDIARRRAAARGLKNVRFVQESLLALPDLGLGRFDFVNCVGVLHHLPDPDAGLRALLQVLAEDGVLHLMVYGRIGRMPVYQMQELLRIVSGPDRDLRSRIADAKQVLGVLPATNWFRRGNDLYTDHREDDGGLADLLLHPQDRAYSVDELYDWLSDAHGLQLILSDVQGGRSAYLPKLRMGPTPPPALLERIAALPMRRQQAIAELLTGRLQKHSLYALREPHTAPYGDPDYVPFLFPELLDGTQIADLLSSNKGQPVVLRHDYAGIAVTVRPGKYGSSVLREMDGVHSFGEIFSRVRRAKGNFGSLPSDEAFFEDFRDVYETLNAMDNLLLRHRSVPPPPRLPL